MHKTPTRKSLGRVYVRDFFIYYIYFLQIQIKNKYNKI